MSGGDVLTAAAALGAGAIGGVFFTFSTFTMRGLTRLAPAQGVAAMQSINAAAVRPPLMIVLFGTAVLCGIEAVRGMLAWEGQGAVIQVTGAFLYLLGTVSVTVIRNVPLNGALAAADPSGDATDALWRDYVRCWTRWNHVRTVASLGAAVAFTAALSG